MNIYVIYRKQMSINSYILIILLRNILIKKIHHLSSSVVTVTICGDACPLSCVSAEAYKLAQCTRLQGWGS